MNALISLCPATWNIIITFLSIDGIRRRHGEAWYQLSILTSDMHSIYETEVLMARVLKLGVWPLQRTEELRLEAVRLPRYFWIKYRLLGPRQYRERGLPRPAALTRNKSSFEWAPWLELRKLDVTLEKLDKAAADNILFPIVGRR